MSTGKVKIVIIDGVYAQIQGMDTSSLSRLSQYFRFRKPNWKFARGERRAGWDGYTNFLSNKTGKFLVGLVPEICLSLDTLGINYGVYKTKTFEKINFDESIINPNMVKVIKDGESFPLRDHQIEYVWSLVENERGIVKAPTGSGKTAIMASMIQLTKKYPTLILFRNKDLLYQTYEEVISMGVPKERAAIYFAGKKESGNIIFCTAQSLHYLEPVLGDFRMLICDEAHEGIIGNSVVPYLRKMKRCYNRFGFTATPWKKGDQVHNYKLKGHFGPQLGDLTTKELQDQGILSVSKTWFIEIEEPENSLFHMEYQEAYRKYVVFNEHLNNTIAQLANEKLDGRTLIIVEHKDHGTNLLEKIPRAIWVSGEDKKEYRREVRQVLRDSPNAVVISTRIFGTGLDIFLHNMINAAGMASDISTIQRYGRGLRKSQDKEYANYIDFKYKINKHLERHSKERIRILKNEGHQINIIDVDSLDKIPTGKI